ncbi:glycosyltransferase family 1 protein [Bacillus sp. HMF5848]|uniref:glycosyltransferase family 4 protein n=1 Tax=Bacillus sp. HMF5848 TaxID=2495421 RepID=UPI000F78B41E|nr:glycosyltransferase family 1 protein [Bacillus sp. HMF5848]RSK27257.1 glycosyltransferase family 1 protein [Bacillus sp. HMF5848]
MRIAIVTETFLPSTDGIVTRLTHSIKWLVKHGHSVDIIAPDLGVNEYEGARVLGVPAHTLFFYKSKKFALPHKVVETYLKEINPDVVHIVNPALVGFSGVYYGKKLKIPIVASYHTNVAQYLDYYHLSPFKPLLWWYFRKLHNQAIINLCTSQTVQYELVERKFNNVHHWKRGVDTDSYHPSNYDDMMRNRLTNNQSDKTLLLYVGRIAAEKEIEKIKSVLTKRDDVCLAIVGDGPHRAQLEKHFSGSNTVFTGFMHGHELAQAYASSDIFVFPSTTETLGLVILEAMASGLPIVAADSGPTREQIHDGSNGMLYKKQDPKSFEEAVLSLCNPHKRDKMKILARQEAEHHGWDGQSQQLLSFYKMAITDNQKWKALA